MLKRRAAGLLAVALAAVVLTLLAAVTLDRVLGVVVPARWMSCGLVFPSGVQLTMDTPEFHCEVRTNELGFRGGPVPSPSPGRIRIVALGDSFTYGWGVALEDAWPMVLQRELRDRGLAVDVFDLASPGAGPEVYADIAERALSLLHPTLVLVGVLQGDDLMQVSVSGSGEVPSGYREPRRLSSRVAALFPTLSRLVAGVRERARRSEGNDRYWEEIGRAFRDGAARVRDGFTPQERDRYGRLEPEVRSLFESGGLNPGLVSLAIRYPRYFLGPLDEDAAMLANRQRGMAATLERIRKAADPLDAPVLALGVPYAAYVSRAAQAQLTRIGFTMDAAALTSDVADVTLARAASAAGVAFFSPTASFRRESATRALYFRWDNHLTPEGHRLFAEQVVGAVEAALASGGARAGS